MAGVKWARKGFRGIVGKVGRASGLGWQQLNSKCLLRQFQRVYGAGLIRVVLSIIDCTGWHQRALDRSSVVVLLIIAFP